MNKKIIMAALAGILTVCVISLSAQDKAQEEAATVEAKEEAVTVEAISAKNTMKILAVAKPTYDLGAKLTEAQNDESNTFGYILNPDSDNPQFVTLSEALAEKSVTNDGTNDVVSFGRFAKGDKVQFGYKDSDNKFNPATINVISSDSGYYSGYNAQGFYTLDFSERPFDGEIEVLIIGEPLPSSAITLILALALVAGYMGYNYRKQRAHAVQRT